jgi:hypothetical protein
VVRSVFAICVWLSAGVGVQPQDRPGPDAFRDALAASRAERHAVRGTVTSMSDHALTITRASRGGDVLVFTMDESTVRSGVIAVGVMVSVRYRYEGNVRLAIAVHGPPSPGEPH